MKKGEYIFAEYLTDTVPNVEISGKSCIYYWLNGEPIRWMDRAGIEHETPRNYLSDGYSFPKRFWRIAAWLDSRIPGFVHDPDYALQPYPKWIIDQNIYLGICSRATGKPWRLRMRIYRAAVETWVGLQIGGWVAWNRYKRELKEFGYEAVLRMHTADTLDEAKLKANYGYR